MATKTKTKLEKTTNESVDSKDVKAVAKYIRGSAKKLRPIANLIRGKHVKVAIGILTNLPNKGAHSILKVLNSAIANAENNNKYDKTNLYITTILIDDAVFFKRHQPRARGRMFPIIKRTSHITVAVNENRGES